MRRSLARVSLLALSIAALVAPHAGMGGRVSVPMRVAPRSGSRRRAFTVVWAASFATAGRVYDVQIRRPGETWDSWRRGVSGRTGTFIAHAGRRLALPRAHA